MSLRSRLRDRELPKEVVRFPGDAAAWASAHAELEEAAAALLDGQRRGAPTEELEARCAAAESAVNELERTEFTVRALSPSDWERLVAEHPAVKDDSHGWDFDPASFYPAMLAAAVCSDGESMSAEEWTEVFASGEGLTLAEKNHLINVALGLNTRAPVVSAAVGKD